MECNKDEAARAKEMAEKKFAAKDHMGAKKLALKAQNLFPDLWGIPQMLAVLDVHISAENKINGQADWYGILGVDPKADDETVRKKYRKLALILHPDKNSSPGADGAFKLISEAWSLLSDKAKRAAYDQKIRNVRVPRNVSTTGAHGFPNFTQSTNFSAAKATKATTQAASFSTSATSQKSNTFWTMCPKCKMKYEYLTIYIHQYLRCRDCQNTFWSLAIAPPINGAKQFSPSNLAEQRQNSNLETANRNTFNTERVSSAASANNQNYYHVFSRTAGGSTAGHAPSVVQVAQTATRKHHAFNQVSGASSTGYVNNAAKRRCMDDVGVSRYGKDAKNQMGWGAGGAGAANFRSDRVNGTSDTIFTSNDISLHATQNILKEKTRKEMNEQGSSSVAETASKEAENGNERGKSSGNVDVQCDRNMSGNGKQVDTKNIGTCDRKQSGTSGFSSDSDAETSEEMISISVPDPDFHDFDKDRTEKSFGENQVWAAYDEDEAMPRHYAKIHSVTSLKPFTLRISWLLSKTNRELGHLNWVSSGFSKTCGEFRVGRHEKSKNTLNSFSHKVLWTKGARGIVCIYPRKGDVWALYKNWSPDWNDLTANEVIHKYVMVEVVEDYSEQLGVAVTPLVKVSGFKTVYRRHLDPTAVMLRIPKNEMFRLSHQVPSHLLTGKEAPNAPKGCWDLDPAATPAELLQIITDGKDEEIMEIDEKVKYENVMKDVENSHDMKMVENPSKVMDEERKKSSKIT